jgi:hypothetical protein
LRQHNLVSVEVDKIRWCCGVKGKRISFVPKPYVVTFFVAAIIYIYRYGDLKKFVAGLGLVYNNHRLFFSIIVAVGNIQLRVAGSKEPLIEKPVQVAPGYFFEMPAAGGVLPQLYTCLRSGTG